VVHGADGRRDVYEVDDSALRAIATDATVALIYSSRLIPDDEGLIQFEARSQQEDQKLCPDQRFAEQPVLAFCSGVFIDDDLVLTAGHCLQASARSPEEACRETSFVFGFHYRAAGTLSGSSGPRLRTPRAGAVWRGVQRPRELRARWWSDGCGGLV
jgi:hypothetical protein